MIRSISIKNWKGLEEMHLSFSEGINFLVGPNGAGKTSVLDAICFALLGNLEATTIYRRLTYKDLIRDPERDMEIVLTFCPQGKDEYTVRRTHSARTRRKQGTLSVNGTVVTERWADATREILRSLETTDLFLRRVILLSEGDTFAYSTQPPGEGLTTHIENFLGINRMEGLSFNLAKLRRDFEVEADRGKADLETVMQSTEADRRKSKELTEQLKGLQKNKDRGSDDIDRLNKQVGALASDMRRAEELIAQAGSVVEEWKQTVGEVPQDYEFLGAIETLQESLDTQRARLIEERDSLRGKLSRLAAQTESHGRVLELVEPLEREGREVTCPVCKRPLTSQMVKDIKDECLKLLTELEGRKKERDGQLPAVDRSIQETDAKWRKLLGIQSKIGLILEQEPRSLSVPVLKPYLKGLVERRDAIQEDVSDLRTQSDEMDKQIGGIEQALAEISKRIDETERLEMMRSLTGATKGQYVSELFLGSLESALAEQRTTLLEPLTGELSTVWSAFLGVQVEVSLRDDAQILILDKRRKASLEFPQLSGGEKTALLIFTQVLLCKCFSSADFMMIDEPLEHLDARNRWALIKYLVDTTRVDGPKQLKQLIVTTIEEPLIREYLGHERVTITLLSREHAVIEPPS